MSKHITALEVIAQGKNPKDLGTTAMKQRPCDNCEDPILPGHVYVSQIMSLGELRRFPNAERAYTPRMGSCLQVKRHLACSSWGEKRLLTLMLEMSGNGRYKYRWRRSGGPR